MEGYIKRNVRIFKVLKDDIANGTSYSVEYLLDSSIEETLSIDGVKIRSFNIPVILLTKDNSYQYNDDYKKIGFNDYLLKPVKKEDLLNKINEYVKRDN